MRAWLVNLQLSSFRDWSSLFLSILLAARLARWLLSKSQVLCRSTWQTLLVDIALAQDTLAPALGGTQVINRLIYIVIPRWRALMNFLLCFHSFPESNLKKVDMRLKLETIKCDLSSDSRQHFPLLGKVTLNISFCISDVTFVGYLTPQFKYITVPIFYFHLFIIFMGRWNYTDSFQSSYAAHKTSMGL